MTAPLWQSFTNQNKCKSNISSTSYFDDRQKSCKIDLLGYTNSDTSKHEGFNYV